MKEAGNDSHTRVPIQRTTSSWKSAPLFEAHLGREGPEGGGGGAGAKFASAQGKELEILLLTGCKRVQELVGCMQDLKLRNSRA